MLIVAIFAGVLLAYLLQFQLYKKKAFEGLRYDVTLSADEVFEGEDVFLYEEIVNTRLLPVPFVKVDTSLPRGLRYCLIEKDEAGNRHGKFSESVQSIFVLRPYQKIKRTWRVNCKTRGEYSVGEVLVVTNDLIGFNHFCFEVDDIFTTVERVRSAGYPIDIEPKQGADLNWQAWVTDPNGIRIELMKIEPESPQAQFWK